MSGSWVRIQFASASAWNAATVSRTPSTRNAAPVTPPIGGRPLVRRWSSQTIAGRRTRSASSRHTTVPRWVVRAIAATASGDAPGIDQSLRHASPNERQYSSGSCSAQPGFGETYGSIGIFARARSSPRGSKRSARTLWVPTSRASNRSAPAARGVVIGRSSSSSGGRARADGRDPSSSSSDPGLSTPAGSNVAASARSAVIPTAPFSAARYGAWSRPTPCWWLIVPPPATIAAEAAALSRAQRSRFRSGSADRRKRYVV